MDLRKAALERANYQCEGTTEFLEDNQWKSERCPIKDGGKFTLHRHHKIPLKYGGEDTLENSKILCYCCHALEDIKYKKANGIPLQTPKTISECLYEKCLECSALPRKLSFYPQVSCLKCRWLKRATNSSRLLVREYEDSLVEMIED